MNGDSSRPKRARIKAPSWLGGNRPLNFFAEAALRTQAISKTSPEWYLRTQESYLNIRPQLTLFDHLAGPVSRQTRFDLLSHLRPPVATGTPDSDMLASIDSLLRRAQQTGEPSDYLSYFQLNISSASDSSLRACVEAAHTSLLGTTGPSGPSDRIFQNSGAHLLRRTEPLLHRIKLPAAWMRIEADPELVAGRTGHLKKAEKIGDPIFASSDNLIDGIYMLDAYSAPLIGALSPAIWALSVPRSVGVVILSLGFSLSGVRSHASELLQVIPQQGSDRSIVFPPLSVDAGSLAIEWWAERLNNLFGIISDPAIFSSRSEEYVATKHAHAILTAEQLFRRVSSIQTSHRDANARRVLLFTVLDTLERLTGRKLETLCKLSYAERTLDLVRSSMPSAASEILLPAAERAVEALRELQDGFFLMRQLGESTVRIPDGRVINLQTPEVAAAKYVKVLRNATHGHGSEHADKAPETDALLANHDGAVPHDLALLGYLYLLRLLIEPESLWKKLYSGGFVVGRQS